MSSKRITGDAVEQAQPLNWRRVHLSHTGDTPGTTPRLYTDEAGTHMLEEREERAEGPSHEEQLRQARETGYREGEAAAAQAARARLDAAVDQLGAAVRELAGYRGRLRREAERDLVGLSIAIAQRILRREVSLDPETVLGVAKAALEKLDAREVCRVRLHPDDVGLLGRRMESIGLGRNVELAADSSITRGGAVVETTRGALDATMEGQLQEIERGLADWMDRK
jgi:flagellar assembly protein FliH